MISPDDILDPFGSELCAAFSDLNISGLFWAWLGYVSCFLTLGTLTPYWNKNSPVRTHCAKEQQREENK